MEYEKMTKAELIEKLIEQEHLAKAVEAKDAEISQLKSSKEQAIKKALDEAQGKLTKTIGEQSDEVDRLKAEHAKALEAQAKSYEAQLQAQAKTLNRRVGELNRFITNFGGLLKLLQGASDLAIDLNGFMVDAVQAKD